MTDEQRGDFNQKANERHQLSRGRMTDEQRGVSHQKKGERQRNSRKLAKLAKLNNNASLAYPLRQCA
jgi:hypothetical protein